MEEDKESKNQPASPKRRRELRERGQVVKSQDVGAVALLAGGMVLLLILGPTFALSLIGGMEDSFREIGKIRADSPIELHTFVIFKEPFLLGMVIFLGAIFVVAVAVQIVQVGFQVTPKTLEPKWTKLNPINGIKQLFSVQKLVTTGLAIIKIVVISGFVYSAFAELSKQPIFLRAVDPIEIGIFERDALWALGWRLILVLTALSAIDYAYQKYKFEKDNRMSNHELKEEFKQMEGNPEIKKKIRSKMRSISLRRMMENMSDATIVITNPTHYAVALRYVRGETEAPVMMAKGARRIARRIREAALNYHIPIMENPQLARGLYKHGQIDQPIPPLYYQAVASILAQLYRRGYRVLESAE